jgi:hypothetical protein
VEPLLNGYVPKHSPNKARIPLIATFFFFFFYKAGEVFSLALLTAFSSFLYTFSLLTVEFLGFLFLRMKIGNWRWNSKAGEGNLGAVLSMFYHFAEYIGILSAPFPII